MVLYDAVFFSYEEIMHHITKYCITLRYFCIVFIYCIYSTTHVKRKYCISYTTAKVKKYIILTLNTKYMTIQ